MNLAVKTKTSLFPLVLLLLLPLFLPKASAWAIQSSDGRCVVVLDPGHGGHDRGALGPGGLSEKELTLALANRVKTILSSTYAVYMTREGDYWLDIEERTALANRHQADAFVSLHAGGSFSHGPQGVVVFSWGTSTSSAAGPQRGEKVYQIPEPLHPWDRIQTTHQASSKLLRDILRKKLMTHLDAVDRTNHQAPLAVLVGADMPAVLVETGYVTHPAQEKELEKATVISDIARAIAEGIEEFLDQTGSCIHQGVVIEKNR